jgi:branched-chain amino acid transport system ATP-binding protein
LGNLEPSLSQIEKNKIFSVKEKEIIMPNQDVSLEVSNLNVVYNRIIAALHNVSFRIKEKEIISILGRNGAGKTTTLRAVSGFFKSEGISISSGEILWHGETLKGKLPFEIVRSGVVLVPEREKIFETLTVQENMLCSVAKGVTAKRKEQIYQEIFSYFPILKSRQKQIAGYLSGGERQMLSIGKALLCSPRLLLIDELSLGLAPLIITSLMDILSKMRCDLGISLLLVEQNAVAALGIADYGLVLENGRIVLEGNPAFLISNPMIRESYLGTSSGKAERRSYRDLRQNKDN